jgi:hypothetical protein
MEKGQSALRIAPFYSALKTPAVYGR